MSYSGLVSAYPSIRRAIAEQYAREVRFYEELDLDEIDESFLMREYCWVVLNSGFREKTVAKVFDYISLCFFDWESSDIILRHSDECISTALYGFCSYRKLNGLVAGIEKINREGVQRIRCEIKRRNWDFFYDMPYLGPVTVLHLARNCGADRAQRKSSSS